MALKSEILLCLLLECWDSQPLLSFFLTQHFGNQFHALSSFSLLSVVLFS